MAGGLAAVTATGALVTFASIAQAANPPSGIGGNIEIFAARDMVALEGYTGHVGQTATVTVVRNGQQVGIGTGVVDSTGFLEFNHPGGSCWTDVTPDIRGGDLVEVRFSGSDVVDGAYTSSAVIPKMTTTTGETVTATAEAPAGVTDGAEWYWVKIAGTFNPAQLQQGDALTDPARFLHESRFGVEVVNPDMREAGSTVGERAIGWNPGPVEAGDEPTTYTTQGDFDEANGTFVAYFGVQTEADRELVLAGEHVALSWMADSPNENIEMQRGLSLYEAGEFNGPGMGGCPQGPGLQGPTAEGISGTLTTEAAPNDTSIAVSWTPPAQAPDANAIEGYRISAVDPTVTTHRQEVSVEVDGAATSATIVGLKAGVSYAIEIEADNGQWSDPVPVGSATPGTAASVTFGSTTQEPTPTDPVDTNDPAPTNVTATATGTDTVDVTWAAAAGATSYEVALTSADGTAVTPVTATATTATVTGLVPGTEYSVLVTALAGEVRTAGTPVTVTTLTAAAPSAVTVTRAIPAHEAIALEWTAAAATNPGSPVTGYDLVATPLVNDVAGTPVTVPVGTVTTGTIPGLANGTAYQVEVYAKSGDLRGPASTLGAGVPATVTPNDQLTVTRSEYRSGRGEYKIAGTAQDTTANAVTITTSGGTPIASNVAVDGTGSWSIDIRNGPVLPADGLIIVDSTSGGHVEATVARRR